MSFPRLDYAKLSVLLALNVSCGSRRCPHGTLLLSTALTFISAGQRAVCVHLAATAALNLNAEYLFDLRVVCSASTRDDSRQLNVKKIKVKEFSVEDNLI